MYKATVRAILRHSVKRLNAGDPNLLIKLAAKECELAFPGDNSWARMYRPVVKGRERHVTHKASRSVLPSRNGSSTGAFSS